MVDDLASIPVVWPRAGKVVVQVNEGERWGRTWLPPMLVEVGFSS